MNLSWVYYSMGTSCMVYLCDGRRRSIQTRLCGTNACAESSEQFSFSFLYYFSSSQDLFLILLFDIFRSFDSDFTIKAKDPVKEHLADSDFRYDTEVLLITSVGFYIWSETVYDTMRK